MNQIENVIMTKHYDFQDKLKGERRERAAEKKKERMDSGKKLKLLSAIILKRSLEAQREADEVEKKKGRRK
ncbi:hypothetical protein LCGC14_1144180 [marine sediment metagenome]|uniref:Uncharacterized protein n=1 Tax=marine sediment metagenome TaxID=412755 RepID=A0A0F9MKH1_9ZZZZ